jgi:hypothetical protein
VGIIGVKDVVVFDEVAREGEGDPKFDLTSWHFALISRWRCVVVLRTNSVYLPLKSLAEWCFITIFRELREALNLHQLAFLSRSTPYSLILPAIKPFMR